MAAQSTFYFAWVEPYETSFNGSHMREDELIFKFELKHEEGQFAELELEIVNPYIALLNGPVWAWFSWNDGSNTYPLFFGRLVAIPDDMFAEEIKIKLVARPSDYGTRQSALADTLKYLPYFDPIFVDDKKLDDPDVVLEGYSALWHVDRFASQVTISDIITGEDGYVYFAGNEVFYDKVKMQLSGAPMLLCEINAEVEWTQCNNTGVFEMKTVRDLTGDTDALKEDGIVTGATPTSTGGGGVIIKPGNPTKPQEKPQEDEEKEPTQTSYSWEYKNVSPPPHKDGDLMEESGSVTVPFYGGELTSKSESFQNADPETGQGEEYSIKESYKLTEEVPPKDQDQQPEQEPFKGGSAMNQPITPDAGATPDPMEADTIDPNRGTTTIAVEVEQDRKEAVYVAVRADVQPVLAQMTEDPETDLVESLSMNSRDVVEAGAATANDGVYFSTARGQQSIEYLLLVARAHLLAGARIVEVEWECPFPKLVYSAMSCRKNAYIADPRLPGGAVVGKIIEYKFEGDGDDGEFIGSVVIGCAVGNGTTVIDGRAVVEPLDITDEGTPVYVEVGYVALGYQHYTGQFVATVTGDMSYETLAFEAAGLQLPITADQIMVRHEYHDAGPSTAVQEILQTGARQLLEFKIDPIGRPITSPPVQALQYAAMEQALNAALAQAVSAEDNQSWVEMEFKPVKGIETRINYVPGTTPLIVPKQIDLSAG